MSELDVFALPSNINSMHGSNGAGVIGIKLKVVQQITNPSNHYAPLNFVGKCIAVSFESNGIIAYLMPESGGAIKCAPLLFTAQVS